MKWTASQQHAIEARGQNLLVSAGAGAGKTATLVERVFRLLTDAHHPVSLEQMLIVTFTRAAAGEMRHRLGEKLRAALHEALDEGAPPEKLRLLREQITLLPRAPISTLDSFCLGLLREVSEEAGLPPDFDVMDPEEASLIHREFIESEIETVLEHGEEGPVLRAIFAQVSPSGGLRLVADLMRNLHGFLESLADPQAFARNVLVELEEAANPNVPFRDKSLARRIETEIRRVLEPVAQAYDTLIRSVSRDHLVLEGTKNYYEQALVARAALRKTIRQLEPDEDLGNLQSAIKPRRRPKAGKNASSADIVLIRIALKLKPVADDAINQLANWGTEYSWRSLVENAASTLGFARLFLLRLGLDVLEKLLDEHRSQRRLTFAQLNRLTLRVLENDSGAPTEAALRFRQEFDYVLVDEFQDVNALQARILRAISRPGGEKGPAGNLFVVGDVKQSIYGFRQADPLQFQEMFDASADYDPRKPARSGARILLRENFRSAPPLLEELNRFFGKLFSKRIGSIEYDDTHRFVAGRTETPADHPRLEFHLMQKDLDAGERDEEQEESKEEPLESDEREAQAVVRYLVDENIRPGDAAILLRSARGYATKIVEALQAAGVPYHTQESVGFLSQQEVRDVLALLRVIDNPYSDVSLVGVLRGPAAEWNENDIARLRLHNREGRLFDNLKEIADAKGDGLGRRAAVFLDQLGEWRRAARSEGMGMFFGRLYNELDWRERVAALSNGGQRLRNLDYLQARGVQFDSFRRKGLGRFLQFVDDLLERDGDLGTPPSVSPSENVVRVMTMHKSKGLQFPVVFLPFLGKRMNLGDARAQVLWDREAGFGVGYLPSRRYGGDPYSAARSMLVQPILDRLHSEEMRLLYVAMTRAEERLILTASDNDPFAQLARCHERVQHPERFNIPESIARAQSYLDWVLLALGDRDELLSLGFDTRISALGEKGFQCRVILETTPFTQKTVGETGSRERLEQAMPEIERMLGRIVRLSDRDDVARVRVKISATEAKRAYEALHTPENPPARPVAFQRADDELPDWWPQSLTGKPLATGRRRGTLTHRFCSLVDLDEIANGRTAIEELERLTGEGYFTPEEAATIPADQVQGFFDDPDIGARVLANRARVRREVPFTVRIGLDELLPSESANRVVVFQGIVDLLFTTEDGSLILLDFKTDRWKQTSQHLQELEQAYTPQIELYRAGIRRALGVQASEAWLYFLSAAQGLPVRATESDTEWLNWLQKACVENINHPAG